MRPIKTASIGPALLARITSRACAFQGLAEPQYHLLHADTRQGFERGAYHVLAALESLGFVVVAPADVE